LGVAVADLLPDTGQLVALIERLHGRRRLVAAFTAGPERALTWPTWPPKCPRRRGR
jgi:hypothetical protein